MARKTIAVDIDDVLAATSAGIVAFSNEQWGMELSLDEYLENWGEMWGVDQKTERERAQQVHDMQVLGQLTHDEQALPVLQELAERFELVIATSRIRQVREETLDWLEQHFPGLFSSVHQSGLFDELRPASHTGTKAQLIQEIGADYLIDDQPKHCFAVAELGLEAILFGDYAWSRDLKLPPRVTRCTDWLAVQEYFRGRS